MKLIKLYDSDAIGYSKHDLAFYEDDGNSYRDHTVYENFKEAKHAALQKLKLQQEDIQKRIAIVEETHEWNCNEVQNPFNT